MPQQDASATAIADDELRNRLNMDEQYSNLVTRQKQRNTSVVKSLLGSVAKQHAEQSLSRFVSKVMSRAFDKFDKKDGFDISEYKNMDDYKINGETIKKVADWYTKAGLIERQGSAISSAKKKE